MGVTDSTMRGCLNHTPFVVNVQGVLIKQGDHNLRKFFTLDRHHACLQYYELQTIHKVGRELGTLFFQEARKAGTSIRVSSEEQTHWTINLNGYSRYGQPIAWRVQAESQNDFDVWLMHLQMACRPRWSPNKPSCEICGDRFTVTKRRHHCRQCGVCGCGRCVPSKISLPHLGYQRARACMQCLPPADHLRVGSTVLVLSRFRGVLRYTGEVAGRPGRWAVVQLPAPLHIHGPRDDSELAASPHFLRKPFPGGSGGGGSSGSSGGGGGGGGGGGARFGVLLPLHLYPLLLQEFSLLTAAAALLQAWQRGRSVRRRQQSILFWTVWNKLDNLQEQQQLRMTSEMASMTSQRGGLGLGTGLELRVSPTDQASLQRLKGGTGAGGGAGGAGGGGGGGERFLQDWEKVPESFSGPRLAFPLTAQSVPELMGHFRANAVLHPADLLTVRCVRSVQPAPPSPPSAD
jgi:uncharacterized membrane protein YgcG